MAGDFLKHSGVLITALGAQAPDTVSTEDTSFRGPKEIIKHAPARFTEAGRITSGRVRDYRQALTSPWTPGCQIHPLLLQSPSSRSLAWQPLPRAQGREERVPRNPLPGARFGVGAIMTRLLSSAPSTPRSPRPFRWGHQARPRLRRGGGSPGNAARGCSAARWHRTA